MREIAENKNYTIEELIEKAEGNLVQDQQDESKRHNLERKRDEEARARLQEE